MTEHVPTTREVREEYAEFDYATSYWLKRGHDVASVRLRSMRGCEAW